ncbi:helix-turn-helix domain-containing protein [Streptomyces sp. NPDC058256]
MPVFRQGTPIRAIAGRTRRSYGSIYALLETAGVLRHRG